MHVPIPNAPRNRRVRPRQLLVDVDSLQRRKVQPAVGSGQEDAKEPGAGKVARQSLRQTPAGLNAITLGEDPRPKGTGCLIAVLLVAIGPPAERHGRDRSVSHVDLTLAVS